MSTTTTTHAFTHITVVGCGLVGGSIAAAAVPHATVTVTDADAAVVDRARDLGIGHAHDVDLAAAVARADLVVVAVPVSVTAEVVATVAKAAKAGAIITDVGSVKAPIVEAVAEAIGPDAEVTFLGGHPMAGSERSGVEAADATLFQGATWMLTPTAAVSPEDLARLAGFLRGLGARVLTVEPALHDRLVAIASHLPQVLASTLMDEAGEAARRTGEAVLAVAAGGFRDVTRIASSDPDLWVGILRENRLAVLDAIDGFLGRLSDLRAALGDEDWDGVRDRLERGRHARSQLPSKDRVGDLVDLVVAVDDRPAVLAEVTTTLGEAGVNIEDLSMRHATALAAGALIVGVDGHEAAERAGRLLADRGFATHLETR